MSISDYELLEVDDLRAQNEKLARELEMEREMGRRVVATKFVEEVCGRVQPDLMQKLADSERDKKELKKLNAQLIREVDRLLWDRSRVANKYSTLYRRERDDCKELKKRLGLYRTSLLSRIEVSQRYAPPPSLPLEILTTIAGFIAGSNNFGTLLSYCMTSKLMQSECQRILLETVVWKDQGLMRDHMTKAEHTRVYPQSWQYIRYIIVDCYTNFWYEDRKMLARAFPNLRAVIIKNRDVLSHYGMEDVPSTVKFGGIEIVRDTSLQTLHSLLEYPLEWKDRRGKCTTFGPILAIHDVKIYGRATLFTRAGLGEELRMPSKYGMRSVNIGIGDSDSHAEERTPRIETCVRTLSQFLPTIEPSDQKSFRLRIDCQRPEDLEVWLHALPLWLASTPKANPQIRFRPDSPEQFTDYALRFARLYKARWVDTYNAREAPGIFFSLCAPVDGVDKLYTSIDYYAHFVKLRPPLTGFEIDVKQCPFVEAWEESEDEAEPVVLHQEHWSPPVAAAESDEEEGNGDADNEESALAAAAND